MYTARSTPRSPTFGSHWPNRGSPASTSERRNSRSLIRFNSTSLRTHGGLMHEDTAHLGEARIARLLDGDFSGAERQAAEAHLADCPACRRELAEVRAILRSAPERRRVVPRRIVAAAAAAALLFFVWPWADRAPEEPLPHRDPALTTTLAPHAVRLLGTVGDTRVLEWTSVA